MNSHNLLFTEAADFKSLFLSDKYVIDQSENIYEAEYDINNEQAEKYNKRAGKYICIQADSDFFNSDFKEKKLIKRLTSAMLRLLSSVNYKGGKALIVGLGNSTITADSLGIGVSSSIDIIKDKITTLSPQVSSLTGIESYDIIKGVAESVKPELIMAVDTLSTRSVERLGRSFQLSNAGIEAGSGVNNAKTPLCYKNLGINVIAIGVPLVIYVKSIISNIINSGAINYEQAKSEIKQLNADNLIVTPSNIDYIVKKLSVILAKTINNALKSA